MLASAEKPARTQARPCPVLVLGVGNILLRDEGVGVRVVQAMERMPLSPEVEVFDGATAGLDLLDVLCDRRKVVVIDAIDADVAPGTVIRFESADLVPRDGQNMSLHEFGLLETLAVARQLGTAPAEVVIIGVKPKDVTCGLELSPEIAGLVPDIINAVTAELKT